MFSEVSDANAGDGLFDRNMAAFAKRFPAIHERLSGVGTPHSSLAVRPDGGVDMLLQGTYFYDEDAVTYVEKQLSRFAEEPTRRFFNEPDTNLLRGMAGAYARQLRQELDGRELAVGAPRDRSGYYTIVFGLGLGLHVEPLQDITACQMMMLIEPNIENLFHSLSVVDWAAMFDKAAHDGREMSFIIEGGVDTILVQLRNAIRNRNPALIDGVYLYTHYHSSALERARDSFNKDLALLVAGLGFLEDEYKMSANAASAIALRRVHVLADPLPRRPEALLIVGSGPSIDRDLERVRELSGEAAVMTVGTGLRVLLDQGIRPDFHVEVENGYENADFIKVVRDEFGFEGILLVGAVSLHDSVRSLFDESILFFRERSSATMLFAEGRGVIQPSGPTVANAALSAAVRMGYRELYFFGLDMGSKADGTYHSRHSVYGAGYFKEIGDEPDVSVPGNFGGEASAESILFWSRYMLENFLRLHPQLDVMNCSDGARIIGATPKLSRVVELAGEPVDRANLRDSIIGKLPTIDANWLDRCWNKETQLADLRALTHKLVEIVAHARAEDKNGRQWMDDLVDAIRYEVDQPPLVKSYFFGSFVLMLGVFWWYEKRMASDEAREQCRAIAFDLMDRAIAHAEHVVSQLINEIDDVLTRSSRAIPIPSESDFKIPGIACNLG